MRSKLIIGGLLASVIAFPTLAQQPAAPDSAAPRAQTTTSTKPMTVSGQWRASKLIGLNVYNDKNESVGEINELLLDPSGKVASVVIGVGGFLGIGERDILVPMDKLKFVNEPVRRAETTTRTETTPRGTTPAGERTTTKTTTTTDRPARSTNEKWYPDHAILSGVTKDSLKSMPEFEYN